MTEEAVLRIIQNMTYNAYSTVILLGKEDAIF